MSYPGTGGNQDSTEKGAFRKEKIADVENIPAQGLM